jgi:hypothetical protein
MHPEMPHSLKFHLLHQSFDWWTLTTFSLACNDILWNCIVIHFFSVSNNDVCLYCITVRLHHVCTKKKKKNIEMFDRNHRNFDRHNHHKRHCDNLRLFQHSKATYEMSPKYKMVHIYNKLHSDIKYLKSFSSFKKAVFNLTVETLFV